MGIVSGLENEKVSSLSKQISRENKTIELVIGFNQFRVQHSGSVRDSARCGCGLVWELDKVIGKRGMIARFSDMGCRKLCWD